MKLSVVKTQKRNSFKENTYQRFLCKMLPLFFQMRWRCSTNLTTRECDTRVIIHSFNKNSVFIFIVGLICYKE